MSTVTTPPRGRTPRGSIALRVFLVLVALRGLGLLPDGLVPLADLVLAVFGAWAAFVLLRRLGERLLWRIRRKLVISYLLIGLVPTVLILFFFLLSGFFILGQVGSYIMASSLEAIERDAFHRAELAAAVLAAPAAPSDETVREALREAIAGVDSAATAFYAERLPSGAVRRLAVGPPLALSETSLLGAPPEGRRGLVRVGEDHVLLAVSRAMGAAATRRVAVAVPLPAALGRVAEQTGFRIQQVLSGQPGEEQEGFRLRAAGPPPLAEPAEEERDGWPRLPWIAVLQASSAAEGEPAGQRFVLVQFAFSFLELYELVTSNGLQIGTDVGRAILVALGVLAGLFLGVEVLAIFVGLMIARSITGSVHELSRGTEHIRRGDFGYKIPVRSKDQLGELADSFNVMTSSIEDLLRQATEKKRLEEELRIARDIQMSLLPKDRVEVPGLAVAAVCRPATEVGGDYFDFLPTGDGRLALLVADVSGKGTSAALYMAELKGLVLSLSAIYDSPHRLLVEANRILSQHLDSRSFITMVYAVLDPTRGRMTFARAGHNPVLHVATNGARRGRTRVLAPPGLGLALDRAGRFGDILVEASMRFEPGDMFFFYTDGLTEAMNPHAELFGEARLRELLERNAALDPDELRERIFDEIFTFAEGADQHDDMTMVIVRAV